MSRERITSQGSLAAPIRVGVMGLGRAAVYGHLPVLMALTGRFDVVAICDLLKERRDRVERDCPAVRTYRRISDMLDDPEIDLVDVCLPTCDHVACVRESLSRGRWTVVEQPLAPTFEEASALRVASLRAPGRLLVYTPGLFAPDFLLATQALAHPLLGDVFDVRIRHQDYCRRDDWQSVKRCAGGTACAEGTGACLEALRLLGGAPARIWGEVKRVAAVGDAEDYLRLLFQGRGTRTVDCEVTGGHLPPAEPSFTLRASRGVFTVAPGAREGIIRALDPAHPLPRLRAASRTPDLDAARERFSFTEVPLRLPDTLTTGPKAFWSAVWSTIRAAVPFPVSLDEILASIRYLQRVKQGTPFAR